MYEEEITGESLMKKIAFVTGSRADYGIVRRYLDLLNKDDDIDLKILVTGALLSETYGNQVKLIYEDGFDIAAEIKVDLDSSSNKMILHTMAQTMEGFADHFATNRYDLLIILGDRYTIKLFVEENDNTLYFENLHPDAYHYLLKKGICLIGNSSSGIIEAPSLGIYTINIGDRQNGRVRGNSVIDIKCESTDIGEAIENVLSYNTNIEKIVNPYYQKDTACHYYTKTKELLSGLESDISEPKRFYDI